MSPERGIEPGEVAASVVLYRPKPEVVANAATYLPHVDRLYVVENTGTEPSGPCRDLLADPRAELVYAEDNPGIARALNAAAEKARADGYRWLLTMDQDSRFAPGVLGQVCDEARHWAPLDDVALIATYLVWDQPDPPSGPIRLMNVGDLLTSGTLVNLAIYEELGGSDERLFIDGVDTDYCIRVRMAGRRILATDRTVLIHGLGARVEFGFGRFRRSYYAHNPVRAYYITRNGLHLYRAYRKRPEGAGLSLTRIASRAAKNVLLGGHPLRAVGYNLRGVADFLRGRWGKI